MEADLGSWPRRLLHVKSMCSFSWEPGNIYGGVRNPRYNALSYTWGRWALQPNQKPDVKSINVAGTTWNIPRVDPRHFDSQDFQNAIDQVARMVSKDPASEDVSYLEDGTGTVEFIWVDIACIDQRFNQESMLELGRQAIIFQHAQDVYVWLNQTTTSDLLEIVLSVDSFALEAYDACMPPAFPLPAQSEVDKLGEDFWQRVTAPVDLEDGWINEAKATIMRLCKDPWFTSLWTLQEAFLRKDAIFLSKEGDSVWSYDEDAEADVPFSLSKVLATCDNLRLTIERNAKIQHTRTRDSACVELLELMKSFGISALSWDNPMEIYAAAWHRKPSNELDSVYGIMQIFGFRLGQSNPQAHQGAKFTLPELEDELGLALMKLCPVFSQAFRQVTAGRDVGSNWRIGSFCTVPGPGFTGRMPWEPQLYETECILSCRRFRGTVWGHFDGIACSFSTMQKAWSYAAHKGQETVFVPEWMDGNSVMCIILDFAPELFPQWQAQSDYDLHRGPVQYQVAEVLATQFDEADVKILHLGSYEPAPEIKCHFGLILLFRKHDSASYWRRLGVCTWDSYGFQRPVYRTYAQLRAQGWCDAENGEPLKGNGNILKRDPESLPELWEEIAVQSGAWKPLTGLFG